MGLNRFGLNRMGPGRKLVWAGAVFDVQSRAMHDRSDSLTKKSGGNRLRLGTATVFCLLFVIWNGRLCSAYSGLIPADPENPGKCVFRGETLRSGVNPGIVPCQQLTCRDDGSILIEGCGKLRIENCNQGERLFLTKPYPYCCQLRYKCLKSDGSPFFIERNAETNSTSGR